jgi:hypothetical protein
MAKEGTAARLFLGRDLVQEAPDGLAGDTDIPSDTQYLNAPIFNAVVNSFRAEAKEPCQFLDVDKPRLAKERVQVILGKQREVI